MTLPKGPFWKGDRVRFTEQALAANLGRARSGYFRDHPDERLGTVLSSTRLYTNILLDGTKAGQVFANEYLKKVV